MDPKSRLIRFFEKYNKESGVFDVSKLMDSLNGGPPALKNTPTEP